MFNAVVSNKDSSPRLYIRLPFPADHLLTLIHFNAYRAIMTNMELLYPIYEMAAHQAQMHICPSPIPSAASSPLVGLLEPPTLVSMPLSLMPTPMQRRIPHPSWIDSIPLARLRDNLISEIGNYDEVALCLDTLGCLFHDHHEKDYEDRKGLIVWSDPWSSSSWELSKGFVHKWGFLLKGCDALVTATNYWRSIRNESHLALRP